MREGVYYELEDDPDFYGQLLTFCVQGRDSDKLEDDSRSL